MEKLLSRLVGGLQGQYKVGKEKDSYMHCYMLVR